MIGLSLTTAEVLSYNGKIKVGLSDMAAQSEVSLATLLPHCFASKNRVALNINSL